jgi:hypothetical protein
MVPLGLKTLTDAFFLDNAHRFDMAHADECGRYMEELVPYAQTHGWPKVGFLRKNPGQTQYNGHAIDALAYDLGNNLTHAVDVIGNAEQPHPWKSEDPINGKDDPKANFGEDMATAYKTDKDWLKTPQSGTQPTPVPVVPWAPYWGDPSSDKITRTFMYDYSRANQSLNPGFGRWLNRCLHSAYMGPEGKPLGPDAALARHRPELCQALGGLDPNVPVPDNFFPEWK